MADDSVASPPSGTSAPAAPGSRAALVELLDRELEGLARELSEIEMLVGQSRTEAGRHEQKRAQAAERLAGLAERGTPAELADANAQLVTLTKRAAVMEAQLDVLAGKQKTLERYRDGLARIRAAAGETTDDGASATGEAGEASPAPGSAGCRRRRPRLRSAGWSSPPRRTSGATSPGPCTTGRPRA